MPAEVAERTLDFLALAEGAETELVRGRQGVWMERLEREHGNFRAALSWALDPEGAQPDERAEQGLRLAAALGRGGFWGAYTLETVVQVAYRVPLLPIVRNLVPQTGSSDSVLPRSAP